MIVVLDCNIWVSLALTQQLKYIALLQKNKITIAGCAELKRELSDVLIRPKFKKYFSKNHVEKLLQFYTLSSVEFEIGEIKSIVTDEKDNYLFALCEVANPEYFVTGDKLLLAEVKYHNTTIISLSDFKALI